MNLQLLFPVLILTAGFLYFIIPIINRKFFQRPNLVLEIEPNKGITSTRSHVSFSDKNDLDLPVNRPETISLYKLKWNFDLIVRNNSEHTAYTIKLYKKGLTAGRIKLKSCINENKPLPKHQEVIIPFEFNIYKEVMHKNLGETDVNEPIEFEDLQLLLDYYNSQRTRFNSLLKFKGRTLSYGRIRKRKIKKDWR